MSVTDWVESRQERKTVWCHANCNAKQFQFHDVMDDFQVFPRYCRVLLHFLDFDKKKTDDGLAMVFRFRERIDDGFSCRFGEGIDSPLYNSIAREK